MAPPRVVALVPAHNEGDRIAATVDGLRALPVSEIVVVDDGSTDGTSPAAVAAGARVWRTAHDVGKGRALDEALDRVADAEVYLFADGDLGGSASGLAPVLDEVLSGRADLCIAVLPPQAGGGFGLVKRLARSAIRRRTGFDPKEPLSGQRAITREALETCRPLARGFGVETAMTLDALKAGLRVAEVPAELHHRPTGRDLRGFLHRATQGLDILLALAARKASPR